MVAQRETGLLHCENHPDIPNGIYALFEMYCTEPDCDCRQVLVLVLPTSGSGDVLAAITFGWEPTDFYHRWLDHVPHGFGAKEEPWSGANMLPGGDCSLHAEAFLRAFRLLVRNRESINRYKRHYRLFRKTCGASVRRTRRNKCWWTAE